MLKVFFKCVFLSNYSHFFSRDSSLTLEFMCWWHPVTHCEYSFTTMDWWVVNYIYSYFRCTAYYYTRQWPGTIAPDPIFITDVMIQLMNINFALWTLITFCFNTCIASHDFLLSMHLFNLESYIVLLFSWRFVWGQRFIKPLLMKIWWEWKIYNSNIKTKVHSYNFYNQLMKAVL